MGQTENKQQEAGLSTIINNPLKDILPKKYTNQNMKMIRGENVVTPCLSEMHPEYKDLERQKNREKEKNRAHATREHADVPTATSGGKTWGRRH